MSKFEVGQEVIFTHGDLKDVLGVVVVPHFQLSQSDWPEVIVQYEEDRRFFVDIHEVRPAEDPYEYNIEITDLITGHTHMLRDLWEPKTDWLERKVAMMDEDDRALLDAGDEPLEFTHKLVKRRKVGKVEDV